MVEPAQPLGGYEKGAVRVTVATTKVETRYGKPAAPLAYRDLIDDELWGRLAARIVKDKGHNRAYAERLLNEFLGFLQACGKAYSPLAVDGEAPDILLRPSEPVDDAWHTFLLYTQEYAETCQRLVGRFIHHKPSDIPGATYDGIGNIAKTVEVMRRFGPVDMELWQDVRADCSTHCGSGGGGGGGK